MPETRSLPWWGLLPLILLAACGSDDQGLSHPLARQIHQQLQQSCQQANTSYVKTVAQLGAEALAPEDSLFQLQDSCQLLVDLKYALGPFFNEPAVESDYDVSQRGDTISARVKPEMAKKRQLQWQKLVLRPDSTITFLAMEVQKRQFLYDLDLSLALRFDSLGQYLSHTQTLRVEVAAGADFHAKTTGSLKSP